MMFTKIEELTCVFRLIELDLDRYLNGPIIELGGVSNSTGFEIYDRANNRFATARYRKNLVRFIHLALGCIPWILYLTAGFSWLLLFVSLSTLLINITLFSIRKNRASQWHATEHKLIWLLEHGGKLTLENLRNVRREADSGCDNKILKEPNGQQLLEAIEVGKEYLNYFKS